MARSHAPPTDRERFMRALHETAGAPHVRVKGDRFETITVERWWCPSCRTPKALQLKYPSWLPYPKPWCTEGCPDIEVYRSLGLEELAFRGSSPPLVVCGVAKAYYGKVGRWPQLGTNDGQWRGSCRKCDGCRRFMAEYQAHVLSEQWAQRIEELSGELPGCEVWAIDVRESEWRRVMDGLRHRVRASGGAIGQVPTQEGRLVVAAFGDVEGTRVGPLRRRLVADGQRIRERRRLPSDPDYGCFATYGIGEQLEHLLLDAFTSRIWQRGGRQARWSFRVYRRTRPDSMP